MESFRLRAARPLPDMPIERAQESLRAAEFCLEARLVNSAASRAYYAMFQAAHVALEAAGVVRARWSHPALQAAFTTESIDRRRAAAFVSAVQDGARHGPKH